MTVQLGRSLLPDILSAITTKLDNGIVNGFGSALAIHNPVIPAQLDNRILPSIPVPASRLKALRTFMKDPCAQFKSREQAQLVEHIITTNENILGILCTSFGKTTMILFLAKMYGIDKTTVVVLPLGSLRDDLHERAHQRDVPNIAWSHHMNPDHSPCLVTVRVEELENASFHRYLGRLVSSDRLGFLFFDEIHRILSDVSYRPCFMHVYKLVKASTNIVGLTASLGPHSIDEFNQLTGTLWRQLRMPSSRKELEYHIFTVKKKDEIHGSIQRYLEVRTSNYNTEDRAIVYFRGRDEADSFAQRMNWSKAYHSGATPEEQHKILREFREGKHIGLASTSLGGSGLDFPHVRDVIHAGLPWSIVDQYQADSRGGRDGLVCQATVFVSQGMQESNSTVPGGPEMTQYVKTRNQCLRIIPTLYLDGVAQTCASISNAALCEYCASQVEGPAPVAKRARSPQSNAPVAKRVRVQSPSQSASPVSFHRTPPPSSPILASSWRTHNPRMPSSPILASSSRTPNPQMPSSPTMVGTSSPTSSDVFSSRENPVYQTPMLDKGKGRASNGGLSGRRFPIQTVAQSYSNSRATQEEKAWTTEYKKPLLRILQEFEQQCPVCLWNKDPEYHHAVFECPQRETWGMGEFGRMRTIKLDPNVFGPACVFCAVEKASINHFFY